MQFHWPLEIAFALHIPALGFSVQIAKSLEDDENAS